MPLVSVIIPTYNRQRFVRKAIDSVLRQSFTDFEIIVIDDGSTDGTQKTLEAYGNKISYMVQENSGVSSARNTGIREAQGVWLAFLDSDDEWTKDYLSTQVAQIEEFPEAVAHVTNAVTLLPGGGRSSLFVETGLSDRFKAKPYLALERPLRVIVKHPPWFLPSSIIRRDILLKAGLLDEELSIAEDLDLIARVALRGPFTFCRKELVEVYRREELIEKSRFYLAHPAAAEGKQVAAEQDAHRRDVHFHRLQLRRAAHAAGRSAVVPRLPQRSAV